MNKEEIKLKLLSEREISYRKLKNKYSELFDLLNISSNDNIQNILYDWCYDDHQTNHKCENPLCDKLSRFNGFKTGYNNTCGSYSCSSKVLPRGRQSKEYLDGVSERRKQEAKQIEFDKMNGTHICDHGCGRTAKFYSSQNKTWRCEERVQDCPSVHDKIVTNVPSSKGISKAEYSSPISWNKIHFCEYGCGGLANYKLSNGKFCCEPYYHSCKGSRDHRSDIMTQKYQDPLVKDNFLSKMNSTLMERHGVSWSFHMADFKKKYQETIQKNYGHGIVHNSMIPEYREINERRLISASYSTKDYIWPSGRISKIQGYEDLALDDLLVVFDESEIQIFSETGKPPIKYFDPEGKSRNYYPDIFIPKLNTIIEVKSQYTFEKDLDINILKKDSCVNNGYIFSWMIYHDRKSKKLDTVNFSFV